MKAKKLVGVVAGSDDDHHQDSVKNGLKLVEQLEEGGRYNACLIEVARNTPWKLHKGTDVAEIDKNKFQAVINDIRVIPDVVLIQAWGSLGESGEIQEYFDTKGVPFSNSGVYQARDTFNKFTCINTLKAIGLPVARSLLFKGNRLPPEEEIVQKITKRIGFPCFVKPNKSSKSHGITKVNQREDLAEAIQVALQFDDEIFMESAVDQGVEVTCTIHDITMDDKLEAFPVTEITHGGEYFHTSNQVNAEISTPAKTLRGEVVAEIIKIAKLAYRTLKLTGLASFDMIVQDELPILLEVNSVPTLGPNSLVQRQVEAGLSMQWQRNVCKFYSIMVDHAVRTFQLIRMKNQKRNENK